MSSPTPPQDPGGVKGFFKHLGNKFKKGRRAKDKDKGSRTHQGGLSVPTTGEGYESSTYSAGQSRSTTPAPKDSTNPATQGSVKAGLEPALQSGPLRPSIRDLPTASTGNEHDIERAPVVSGNTVGTNVAPLSFDEPPASAGGYNDHAGGVPNDGNTQVLPSKAKDLESSASSATGPIEIRAPPASLAVDKSLPPLNALIAKQSVVDASDASSASDDGAKSASDASVHVPTQASNRTARLWFNAAAGFGKTLLKKLPDVVDTNPVKVVAAIVKVAIEAAETVGDNKDNLIRLSTKLESLAQLEVTEDGIPTGAEAIHTSLKEALSNASASISNLTNQSRVLQAISFEQYSKEIQGVFDAIDDAVQVFQVQIATNIEAKAEKILEMARDEKLYRLNPSPGAHYDSDVEGQRIRREECTKGTRVEILENITNWARDDSPQSPLVYWLTGQAGSGKTSIATSIAAEFSGAEEGITLGANFFCSRNTPETNTTRRIVPTIAYQLARKCAPYAEALIVPSKLDKLDNVYRPVPKQLQSLFFIPWVQCEARRNESKYLIVIDALDELKENGSVEFIDALFALFKASPVNGIKIFITSRSEHEIINRIEPFYSRTIRWLQEVPLEDVSGDIKTYLKERLPTLGDDNLDKLRDIAGGLFIYAATAVRYLKPRENTPIREQAYRLEKFLKHPRHGGSDRPNFIVDELYRTIMVEALHPHIEDSTLYMARLKAIHLILSTGERASAGAIAALFNIMENGDFPLTEDEVVSVVQTDLHSVLYVKDGLIFWYHASFPDFIFNPSRSNFKFVLSRTEVYDFEFTCNEDNQQTRLRNLCFEKLKELTFNMSCIPSSFALDQDLAHIPDALLVYSATNWSHHLPITGGAGADDIGDFLGLRALFWVELMNIIKRVGDCVSILERAQRWVRQHIVGNEAALDERLSEVIKFVDDFQKDELRSSTPHLYVSHLAEWSGGPKTIQRWKENFRNLPHITHSHKDIPLIFTADGQNLKKDELVPPEVKLENGRITSVAFLNKDSQILSGYEDGSISIWDASTGALQIHLEVDEQQLSSYDSDNATAMTGFDDCMCVWNRVGGDSVHFAGNSNTGFWSIAASADGTTIRSESLEGKVYIWHLSSGRWELVTVSQFESADPSVQGTVSPNGRYLVSITSDEVAQIRVTPTGQSINCPPLESALSVAIYQRDTKVRFVYRHGDNELVYLEQINVKDDSCDQTNHDDLQEKTSVLPYDAYFDGVTISPDTSTIAARGWIWNHVTGNQHKLPYDGSGWRVRSLAISEDNKLLLYCDYTSIRLWDISGQTKSALLKEHVDSTMDFQHWALQEDGWIVSSDTRDRLMWVPQSFRKQQCFAVPENILLISGKGYYSVDLSKAKIGKDWAECYTPTTSAGPT